MIMEVRKPEDASSGGRVSGGSSIVGRRCWPALDFAVFRRLNMSREAQVVARAQKILPRTPFSRRGSVHAG
jgi:hypothetical protein